MVTGTNTSPCWKPHSLRYQRWKDFGSQLDNIFPFGFLGQTYMRYGFLTQNIVPSPGFQLAQPFNRNKFTPANQQNGNTCGQQSPHVGQQCQDNPGRTVPASLFDPSLGNRYGSPEVCQTNHQQLMPVINLGPIQDQLDLESMLGLSFQLLANNGLIAIPRGRLL